MQYRCQYTEADGARCVQYVEVGRKYCIPHATAMTIVESVGYWKWVFIIALFFWFIGLIEDIIRSSLIFLSHANIMDLNRMIAFLSHSLLYVSLCGILLRPSKVFWSKLNLWSMGLLAFVSLTTTVTLLALWAFPESFIWRFRGADFSPGFYEVLVRLFILVLSAGYVICAIDPKFASILSEYWWLPLVMIVSGFFAFAPVLRILYLLLFWGFYFDYKFRWTERIFRW